MKFSTFAVAIFSLVVLVGCGNKYVDLPIDEIEYAAPTEEALAFDVEGRINNLPEILYDKIDYPVEETAMYAFNDHMLIVDLPKGFAAHYIGEKIDPKIIVSTNIEDSCRIDTISSGPTGVCIGHWGGSTVRADKSLCIVDTSIHDETHFCEGIQIVPVKSLYQGVSVRDIFHNTAWSDSAALPPVGKIEARNITLPINERGEASVLLSDHQSMYISRDPILRTNKEALPDDLVYSILSSIQVTPQ